MSRPNANDILRFLQELGVDGRVTARGAADFVVERIDHPETSGPSSVCWLKKGRAPPRDWNGGLLLVAYGVTHPEPQGDHPFLVISCDNPRLAFIKVITRFFLDLVEYPRGGLRAPENAVIHPSAQIGFSGQGYEWDEDLQQWLEMPHVGGVVLGARVSIGPLTTIMRGVIGDTIIGNGTKIGHHVNVGHNVQIGNDCLIIAHATIGGSAKVGNRVKIWQNASIANGVKIGDHAEIGMGAVVLKDVPDGEVWAGNPARKLR